MSAAMQFDGDGNLWVREYGVLGVWRDELDVEHVRLHRIVKP